MKQAELDAEIQAFVDQYIAWARPSTSLEQQRRDYDNLLRHFRHPHPTGISIRDSLIEGRHRSIPLRHYQLRNGNGEALLLFVRGGGFVLGNLDSHDDICADLCALSGYDLVAVDYRRAPEHLHPAAVDDIEQAFNHCAHPRTILLGVSAGGTLAAALCHRLRNAAHRPSGQLLVYPSLGGHCFDLDSYHINAAAPLLSAADVDYYHRSRCAAAPPLTDAEFYPLVAADFSRAPTTVVISADIDPLRDDARLYVEKLQRDHVSATWINEPGLVHDFLRARHISRRAGAAFQRIGAAINRLAAQPHNADRYCC